MSNPRFITFAGRMVRTEHIVNAVVTNDADGTSLPGVIVEVHEPGTDPLYLTEVAFVFSQPGESDEAEQARRTAAAYDLLATVCRKCNGDPEPPTPQPAPIAVPSIDWPHRGPDLELEGTGGTW